MFFKIQNLSLPVFILGMGLSACQARNYAPTSMMAVTNNKKTLTMKPSNDKGLQERANVGNVDIIKNQEKDIKIFTMVGGDPAMNGAYVHMGIYDETQKRYRVFEIDDVSDYKVLPSSQGFIKLRLVKDFMSSNGDIMKKTINLNLEIKDFARGTIKNGETIIKESQNPKAITMSDVYQVLPLNDNNYSAHFFAYGGGDPAMNGTYLNLAVFVDMNRGWNIFSLGDIADFEVVKSAKPGYARLNIIKDIMNSDGTIGKQKSVMYINMTQSSQTNGNLLVEEQFSESR